MEKFFIENASQILLSLCVVLLAYTFYTYSRYFKRWSSLPTFKPHTLVSYIRSIRHWDKVKEIPALCYIYELFSGICQLNTEGICLYWVFFSPYVFVYKPKFVKELICHPDAQDKSDMYEFFTIFGGQGLVTANGDHWQNHRKLISPSFNNELLKEYISIFNEQAEIFTRKLKTAVGKPWTDISHFIDSCGFDIITESTLGIKIGSQDGNEEARTIISCCDDVTKIGVHRISRPWTHWDFLFKLFPMGKEMMKTKKFLEDFGNKIISEKKESLLSQKKDKAEGKEIDSETSKKSKSFLERLLNCHLENPSFTTTDIRDELIQMIGAGHESTALTLQYAIYLVGLHPDVQENIVLEQDHIFENDPNRMVTYKDLSEMIYLTSVIKEALRIFPTVPILARKTRADIQVDKYMVPKDSIILFPFHGMYRDPEIYPDPEKFQPERFLPDNARNVHQFAFIPFSAGSRNCLGQKFAMMEMKVILSNLFRNFKVESLDQRDKIITTWEITLKSVQPIRIRIIARH